MAAAENESPHPVDAHVGARIRLRRRLKGMSQEVLGNAAGVTFQQLQKYERGANRVSASKLWEIAQALEVPVGYFFEGLEADFEDDPQTQRIVRFLQSEDGVSFADALAEIDNRDIRIRILWLVRALGKRVEGRNQIG